MASNEGTRKDGKFIAVNTTPDVCKTPMGNSVVPVPYAITATLNDSASVSNNVNFGGKQAFVLNKSKVTKVTGDESGTAGGVKSGTNKSIVEPVGASSTVRVNRKRVVRHADPCKMNNGNTMGKFIYQGASAGKKGGNSNPPAKPETRQEKKTAAEKKGIWAKMSDTVHGALDVAGFIPGLGAIPDLANAAIYGLEGNAAMAGLSVVAAVPGIGDGVKGATMVGKGAKGLAKRAAKKQASKKAAKELADRAAREKLEIDITEELMKKKAEKASTRKAAEEVAEAGQDGLTVGGKVKPRKPRKPDKKKWEESGGTVKQNRDGSVTYTNKEGQSVTYNREGYPDFGPHSQGQVEISNMKGDSSDFIKSNKEYRKQVNDPNWKKPGDMTWHHHQDGKTMQLVDRDIHGQFSHTGGASISRGNK